MKVLFEPLHREVEVAPGTTLLDSALRAGVELPSDCGGRGRCGKCRVVARGGLTPPNRRERTRLSEEEPAHVRLACQAAVEGAVEVFLPETGRRVERILTEGAHRAVPLRPLLRKVRLDPASREGGHGRSLAETVEDALRAAGVRRPTLSFAAVRALPGLLGAGRGDLTALVAGDEVVGLEEGDTTARFYGLAVDLGTTTVVGYLYDLTRGECVGVESALNAQVELGSDVVSRIEHALVAPGGAEELRARLLATVNGVARRLCGERGVCAESVYLAAIVGNTPMNHLLLGVSPRFLARAPYPPVAKGALCLSAAEVGLAVHPAGRVLLLPLVSGFIGSDTVAVVLATGLHRSRAPRLAIDIGTNGEIVLTDGKQLVACSCAAGPAFEGAHVRCGMRGAGGAIDRVEVAPGPELRCHVIGGGPARGICGSGLVDAAACLLRSGLLAPDGRLRDGSELSGVPFAERLGKRQFGEFLLAAGDPEHEAVVITQRDLRELQLAKGALRAGIGTLLARLDLAEDDVREVYLAGAFGNYVRPESAVAIGLLPAFPRAKITPVGNAAGGGARMALLSGRAFEEAQIVARRVSYVELAELPGFQRDFVAAMRFPG